MNQLTRRGLFRRLPVAVGALFVPVQPDQQMTMNLVIDGKELAESIAKHLPVIEVTCHTEAVEAKQRLLEVLKDNFEHGTIHEGGF